MKKVLMISLALMLTLAACGVVEPVQQEQPTPIIATVLVTVIPPTEVLPPTAVPLPTEEPPTEVPPTVAPTETLVPTDIPQPTEALPTVDASSSSSDLTPVTIENVLGKGVFTNITFSSNVLTMRCYPREMTISITANRPEITSAVLYYRIVDNPAALYPSVWKSIGEMTSDRQGNFTQVFTGLDVHPDLRLDKAWIDFQFIGLNKGGGVVDRTEKIERFVTYYKDCP